MKKYEEKMSPMARAILFVVILTALFLIVIMEKESQEKEAAKANTSKSPSKSGSIPEIVATPDGCCFWEYITLSHVASSGTV